MHTNTLDLNNLTQKDLAPIIRIVRKVCAKRQFSPLDPDYDSAINFAVYKAIATFKDGEQTLTSLAVLYALNLCEKVESQHRTWWKQDQAGACRGKETSYMKEDIQDPALSDFEFLSFVAAHGRTKAAKLLGVRRTKVISLLDEVILRLKNRE